MSAVLNPQRPNVKKADLIPGDILLLIDEPHDTEKLHKIIIAGQKLEGLSMLRNNIGKKPVRFTQYCGLEIPKIQFQPSVVGRGE
nr:hypothetical protein [Pseudomonas syringae]UVN18306.1 hypothetical protein pPsy0462c_00047 [Pseudomonas syringae]